MVRSTSSAQGTSLDISKRSSLNGKVEGAIHCVSDIYISDILSGIWSDIPSREYATSNILSDAVWVRLCRGSWQGRRAGSRAGSEAGRRSEWPGCPVKIIQNLESLTKGTPCHPCIYTPNSDTYRHVMTCLDKVKMRNLRVADKCQWA